MRRNAGWLLPVVLAVAGATLIVLGQLDLDGPPPGSLPPIPTPTPTAIAQATPSASATDHVSGSAGPSGSATTTPIPDDVVAVQLEVPSVGINVAVQQASDPATCDFPPDDAAYILCGSSQPGRGTNSYLFAHAVNHLFKPLWNVQVGADVRVLLSDGTVLSYRVSEVRPNVACPDPAAEPHPDPPLALLYAPEDCTAGAEWTRPTAYERLTLQTSQGFNRNWGELVIVARPIQ